MFCEMKRQKFDKKKIGSHFKANTFSVHNSLFYICANFIQHSSIKAKTAALFRKPAN